MGKDLPQALHLREDANSAPYQLFSGSGALFLGLCFEFLDLLLDTIQDVLEVFGLAP